MPFKLRTEFPTAPNINQLVTPIRGWVASDEPIAKITLYYGDVVVPTRLEHRADVERVFPDKIGTGYRAKIDFRSGTIPDQNTDIFISVDGTLQVLGKLMAGDIAEKATAWRTIKAKKLDRLRGILACPVCSAPINEVKSDRDFVCEGCSAPFSQSDTHIDMLPSVFREQFKLIETENVSEHPYAPEVRAFFDSVSGRGGIVLDMGAGDQSHIDPAVICSEIVPYNSTDVLAVGQKLPFRSASFDAVYSNAVLEHVTDPFACAAEMMRVLKPGGRVFCSVPFLQPEHGYPHHYYNMTQDGLVNLFTRCEATLETKAVPDWGHPLSASQWFLSEYLKYLPAQERTRMESLTIADYLRLRRSRAEPIFANLSEDGRRILASATYATFVK